jgi:hypothetical protein
VPSFILAPLRPLQTLKALFPEESTETPAKPEAEPKPEPTTPPPVAEPKP